jgi:hypothetical protein
MPSRTAIRTGLAISAAVFATLILVQVFLAGLGVFGDDRSFASHRTFGYVIGWLTLVIVVLAVAGRVGGRLLGLSFLTLAQMALQSVFVLVRADLPAVAALHPVNGVLLLVVAIAIARGAWRSREAAARDEASGVGERSVA